MPSAHAAMDGGKSCPQHEHQQAGDALYSVPAFRSQLAVPAMEVRAPQQRARLPWGCPRRGLGKAAQLGSRIPGALVGVCGSHLPDLLGSCPGAGGIDRECWKVEVTAVYLLPWTWEEKNKAVIKTTPP